MSVETTYPHIESAAGESPRIARFPRVRVSQIVTDHLAYGWSADEICRQHPHLTLAEVHAALLYYFDHQAEIEREIRDDAALFAAARRDAAQPSPFRLRMQIG
ncbi:MAG: DUF433 domain-containing protein [Planctomycetaceae bacterium]